jgi:opacity protein-like surface antigen
MKRVLLTVASTALLAVSAGAVQAQPPGHAKGQGKVSAGAHGPNVHASGRAHDVHRMLDAGENPGYAYGRDDTRVRGDDRGPNAKASARAHEVHRMLDADENPGHHYGQTKTRAGAKARANTRGKARVKANAKAKSKTR